MGNCTGAQNADLNNEFNNKLLIKTSTWVRDSHELFDYESPNLMKRTFKLINTSDIKREENDISIINRQDKKPVVKDWSKENPEEQKQGNLSNHIISFVQQQKGQYSLFDQEHRFDNLTHHSYLLSNGQNMSVKNDSRGMQSLITKSEDTDQDLNKLWFIVRYMTVENKTNHFKLIGGETIKLGRVKLTVREVHLGEDENQTDYCDSFENQSHNMNDSISVRDQQVRGPESMMPIQRAMRNIEHFHSYENLNDNSIAQHDILEEEKVIDNYSINDSGSGNINNQIRGTRSRVANSLRRSRLIEDTLICLSQEEQRIRDNLMGFNVNQEYQGDQSQEEDIENDLMKHQQLMIHEDLEVSRASIRDQDELHKTMLTNQNNQSENQNLCRICFSELYTEENPLISPCKCSGSMKHIHLECLRIWLSRKENVKNSAFVTSYSWKAFHCELCKSEYNDRIMVDHKEFWLFEIQKPKANYIILESVQMQNSQPNNNHNNNNNSNNYNYQSKTLHILNLNQKNIIKIGRGHDVDLRVADISVSRCHAYIKKDPKGYFYLEDNQSKFGTLVLIKAPILLNEQITYYIQAGRTIMKLNVQHEWSLLNGIIRNNKRSTSQGVKKQPQIRSEMDIKSCQQNKNKQASNIINDFFFDNIGKYCSHDASKLIDLVKQLQIKECLTSQSKDEQENVNDTSVGEIIPEEKGDVNQYEGIQLLNKDKQQIFSPSRNLNGKIQEIKTNSFKIKLTTLKDQYSNEKIISISNYLSNLKSPNENQEVSEEQKSQRSRQPFVSPSPFRRQIDVSDELQLSNIKSSNYILKTPQMLEYADEPILINHISAKSIPSSSFNKISKQKQLKQIILNELNSNNQQSKNIANKQQQKPEITNNRCSMPVQPKSLRPSLTQENMTKGYISRPKQQILVDSSICRKSPRIKAIQVQQQNIACKNNNEDLKLIDETKQGLIFNEYKSKYQVLNLQVPQINSKMSQSSKNSQKLTPKIGGIKSQARFILPPDQLITHPSSVKSQSKNNHKYTKSSHFIATQKNKLA
ncbi:fha domain [Stylonychia lemnae]|uniref:Fha domain n=1 Tax=Stylonychia lemnae TaxID=5949 RepID=A0A078A0B1_STYLE|nr:fha domain [Stylonychia lemnae]|eukprot:CDW75312.1 fha domain [Stylonychia lemnae]